jgi:hypothetical protein
MPACQIEKAAIEYMLIYKSKKALIIVNGEFEIC